jgi:hypothetical protein
MSGRRPSEGMAFALLCVALAMLACGRLGGGDGETRTRADHERLRAAFAELAARDPVVSEVLARKGDVVVGVRPALVQSLLGGVAAHYLDQVSLDLRLEEKIHEARELHVGTFLGRIHAGAWTLDLTIHRVRGVLRAGSPRLTSAPDNALAVVIPVAIQEGHGTATVHFKWESRSVASVVCHDFEVTKQLSGEVLPREYPVSGRFQLSAAPERLRAEPVFPPHAFRIHVDLSDASWKQVRDAINEQDDVLHCGLALDPDDLVARLRARLREGFDVKLPRSLFRAVDFPAAVRQEATIGEAQVALAVETRGLAVTPAAVWYSADVRTRISPAEAASPGGESPR